MDKIAKLEHFFSFFFFADFRERGRECPLPPLNPPLKLVAARGPNILQTFCVYKITGFRQCTCIFVLCLSCEQYTVISWLRGEQSNYCPEVVEKIRETVARGRGQQFPRSSPLPRDNGLTAPQVALK